MKAIILAAGQAKRLRPITHDTPKCLLRIGNKCLLENQIDILIKNGVNEIFIVVGYKKDKIINFIRQKSYNINIKIIENNEFESTNAAHSLYLARNHLFGSIIYLNADLLCEDEIIKKVINSKRSVTAIQKVKWDEEAVNVILNSKSEIVEIGKHIDEKSNHGEFIGATKLNKEFSLKLVNVLEKFEINNEKNHFAVDAINKVIRSNECKLFGLDVTNYFAKEIDTVEDYNDAISAYNNLYK